MLQWTQGNVEISWFGLDLDEGLQEGSFVQQGRRAVTFKHKDTGYGRTVRMYNPSTSGTITLLVNSVTKTHQRLILLANTDRITRAVVGPMIIYDTNLDEVSFYNKASIQGMPNNVKATVPAIIPWIFEYETELRQGFDFDKATVGQ